MSKFDQIKVGLHNFNKLVYIQLGSFPIPIPNPLINVRNGTRALNSNKLGCVRFE